MSDFDKDYRTRSSDAILVIGMQREGTELQQAMDTMSCLEERALFHSFHDSSDAKKINFLDNLIIMANLIRILEGSSILLNLESTTLLKKDQSTVVHHLVNDLVVRNLLTEDQETELKTSILEEDIVVSNKKTISCTLAFGFCEVLANPIVAFARLVRSIGVEFHNKCPAKCVFLFLGSSRHASELLQMGYISSIMCDDDEFCYAILAAKTRQEIIIPMKIFQRRFMETKKRHLSRSSFCSGDSLYFNSNYDHSLLSSSSRKIEHSNISLRFAKCLIREVRQKLPWYISDFKDGCHLKCLAAIFLLFFACLAPTVTFGTVMNSSTNGHIGVSEALLATMIHGVIFSLTSAQPLILLGTTGPFLIFTDILYQLSKVLQQPFLYLYLWTGIWMSLITILVSVFNLCVLIHYCTKFTDEIFCALISVVYILDPWTRGFISLARSSSSSTANVLMSFILLTGTFCILCLFRRLRTSIYLRSFVRSFLIDFGYIIAILIMTGFSYVWPSSNVEHLEVPRGLRLSMPRPWLIPWNGKEVFYTINQNLKDPQYGVRNAALWIIPFTLIPGTLGSVLVFLDTNLTSRLVNSSANKLRKGQGFHLDYFVVGILLFISSIVGLPWFYAATIRSLTHLTSLSRTENHISNGKIIEKVVGVYENRLTGLVIHILVGLSIFLTVVLNKIPIFILLGLFSFMGYAAFASTELFERTKLFFKDPALSSTSYYDHKIPINKVHLFTWIQLALIAFLYVISELTTFIRDSSIAPWIAISFPLFILLLVPTRNRILPLFIRSEYLAVLDPVGY